MRVFALALILAATSAYAGQTRLAPEYRAQYEAVQACLGLTAREPKWQLRDTVPCPTSGNLRCMAGYPPFQCGAVVCGYSGLSYPWDNRIELPDKYIASFTHEAVHHILWWNNDPNWGDHSHPAFRCQ